MASVVFFIFYLYSLQSVYADHEIDRGLENKSTFIFHFENDTFAGTDRYYSNGIKLAWISKDLRKNGSDGHLPDWAGWLVDRTPALNRKDFLHNLAIALGQNIYTPDDIYAEELIEDDRPFAGWLYLSAALHSRNIHLLNTLELSVGVVGPSSLAEDSQKWAHSKDPQGWTNQLEDEPGVMLTWQRFWRASRKHVGRGFAYDFIPHAGVTLGNVMTFANAGAEIRYGYNLPDDFGTFLIRPGGGTPVPVSMGDPRLSTHSNFGLSIFFGTDGRAIARNIFLDGNTWQDSHSIDKNALVADVFAGISGVYKFVQVTYAHVYRTEEFEGQDGGQFFGSISLAVTF